MEDKENKMGIEEIVEKCKKHFNYYDIVDEYSATIDYGSIFEFVACEYAKSILKGIGIKIEGEEE